MFGKKTNLRKLIDSVNKDDFNYFKGVYGRITKESELAKKLYEKLNEHSVPENVMGFTIIFGDRNLYRTEDHKDEYVSFKVSEYYYSCDKDYKRTTTISGVVNVDDDVVKALSHFGPRLLYRSRAKVEEENIVNEYIDNKAFRYGVILDNETYRKLRNLVESFN